MSAASSGVPKSGRLAKRRLPRPAVLAAILAGTAIAGATAVGANQVLAASAGPALTVDATADVHSISPYIYGMAYAANNVTAALRIPIQRWGGDATTRYNWEQDSSNAGGDWYFMSGSGDADPVPSAGPDALESQAQSIGGTTLMTVPIIPWINNSSATNCSFPTPPYPAQTSYNPYVTLDGGAVKCGDGVDAATGDDLTDNDISSNNMANSPAFQEQWVDHLVSKFGDAAHGGVAVYEMDNEPSGWDNTHRDVHPLQTGWDELVDDTEEYAAAVKAADPTAQVDGPGDFGWAAYIDDGPPGDNRASHGGSIWEAQYYLQQMAAYQQAHGVRLLDYFDEHYYPTTPSDVDDCIALCEEGDAETQAARLESTRSLWDPTYVEDDWIGEWYGAIDLIPRMQSWVNQYYPGTKIAISEYNFGALDSLNGALTEADVLGIFGAENVGLASLWSPPSLGQPGAFSFAMYRDYDGKGDGFGDTSVEATSADRDDMSVYAATRSSDGALTLMVINKTGTDLTSPLSIRDFDAGNEAQVFTYDNSDLSAIVQQPDQPVSDGSLSMTFPASSITLLVIPPAQATGPTGATGAGTTTSTSSTSTSTSSTSTTTSSTSTTRPPSSTTSSTSTTRPPSSTTSSSTSSTSTTRPPSSTTSSTSTTRPSSSTTSSSTSTTRPPSSTTSSTRPESTTGPPGSGSSPSTTLGSGAAGGEGSTTTSTPAGTGAGGSGDGRHPGRQRASGLAVRSVTPDRLRRGDLDVQISVAGSGFGSGLELRVSGTGVELAAVRLDGPDRLSGEVSVGRHAPLGPRDLVVDLDGHVVRCTDCLRVTRRLAAPTHAVRSALQSRSGSRHLQERSVAAAVTSGGPSPLSLAAQGNDRLKTVRLH